MVSKMHRLLSLVLCVMTVMSLLTVGMVSTSAAAGDTVYCENAGDWGEVYCYMWTGGDNNGAWPGQKMTKGENDLWSYQVTGDWENVIFNNGNGTKTGDLSYPGNGGCFNNQTNGWTTIDAPTNPVTHTDPVTPTTPTTPKTPESVGSGEYAVYCKNTAGWGSVSIYMWNSGDDNNAAWPGKTATNIGDDVWMITVDKAFKNVIFSNGGGTQTKDLAFPGSEYIFNNSTNQWEVYDLTKLRITSATADPASPQYTGVEVKLSMEAAGGEGDLQYQFAADSTVISDYSPLNTATWTPTKAGTYTIKFSVKDSAGEVVENTMSFQVKDINAEVKPVVQSVLVTPTNSENNEIEKGKVANIDITAGGGNTGTKLLFYKVKITDPKGNVSNVPYYTTGDQYKFTPTALGTYEIAVSVQGSDNSTVTRTYRYECVDKLSAPGELKVTASASGKQTAGSTVVITAAAYGGVAPYTYEFKINGQTVQAYSSKNTFSLTLEAKATYDIAVSAKDSEGAVATKTILIEVPEDAKPTDPPTPTTPTNPTNPTTPTTPTNPIVPSVGLKGDADCDGKVNVKDATAVQKHVAGIEKLSAQGMINAEVDGNETINVKDATAIQKKVAGIITQW